MNATVSVHKDQSTSDLYEGDNPKFEVFKYLTKGSPAPFWLFSGVCAAWGLHKDEVDLSLITISENATFLLKIKDEPIGVVRVSEPDYVGGPKAIASELAWINMLHELDGVNLVTPVPTVMGPYVAEIHQNETTKWSVISTKFIEGTVLEDMADPSSCYRVIGNWSAKFHKSARSWTEPYGFQRFSWDLLDILGPHPRWGRWEEAAGLTPAENKLLYQAMWEALAYVAKQPRNRQTWGLVHADLRPSNIIQRPDGQFVVLDFDDCGYSWYLWDYAASLTFIEHESYAPRLAYEWVEGYRESGELNDSDFEMMSALSMLRRLQMLGWTTRHRADALPDGLYAAQKPGSLMCAERYLKDHNWLLEEAFANRTETQPPEPVDSRTMEVIPHQ
ncbi:phosphotransferase enzyme family protein [Bifidobacterium olomucense]|uniref:Phosphotransferase n=1 Tax=Bifidobacterium olomucense TaxID=2675324 RepID=A0A7Y0EZP0_9BIFI|nr:phosphotransferase [Bifidobacterium sp. DSM 109959]NMM99351.1 phosphotransferase [Bifidobacterium sp. DSM 109959]